MSAAAPLAIDPGVLREVRRLELRTKRTLSSDFIGRFRSSFRGSGLTFHDLREYQPGDDIKAIHWKATARSTKVYVKSYLEERSLDVAMAVDMSASMGFGTERPNFRRAVDFVSLISVLCAKSGDGLGLTLFEDGVREHLPTSRRRTQLSRVLLKLLDTPPSGKKSDLASTLTFLRTNIRRGSVIFVVSDFFTPPFEDELRALAVRHDVILVHLTEKQQSFQKFVGQGLLEVVDAESGERILLDTSSRSVRELFARASNRSEELSLLATRTGADYIQLVDNSFRPLSELMQKRAKRFR
jgi:uncharacterized protein (DUF58 family)